MAAGFPSAHSRVWGRRTARKQCLDMWDFMFRWSFKFSSNESQWTWAQSSNWGWSPLISGAFRWATFPISCQKNEQWENSNMWLGVRRSDLPCLSWQALAWMFCLVCCEVSTLLTSLVLVRAWKGRGGSHQEDLSAGCVVSWHGTTATCAPSRRGEVQTKQASSKLGLKGRQGESMARANRPGPVLCVLVLYLNQCLVCMWHAWTLCPELESLGFAAWPWLAGDPDSRRANGEGWGMKRRPSSCQGLPSSTT